MPAKKKLLIFPFNGNGIEALDCIDEAAFEFLGFIDDNPEKLMAKNPWPVFPREILHKHPDAFVLAVPGSPLSFTERAGHIKSLDIPAERLISLVHPAAHLGRNVRLGANCLVLAGVVITSNAQLGDHICILPNTVIHHDVRIGDYSLVGSNVAIAGGTVIGRNCYIGSGTNIINGVTIGEYSLIGLGSNVINSLPGGSRVAGNPARQIPEKK